MVLPCDQHSSGKCLQPFVDVMPDFVHGGVELLEDSQEGHEYVEMACGGALLEYFQ